jgi:hypothetical protein
MQLHSAHKHNIEPTTNFVRDTYKALPFNQFNFYRTKFTEPRRLRRLTASIAKRDLKNRHQTSSKR